MTRNHLFMGDFQSFLKEENVKVNTVYKEDKKFFCTGKECVLIDDTEKNIEEWESFGGTGVLFTTVNDAIEKLKELGVL